MKPSPKIAIVVLNYAGKDTIRRCLASLFKVSYPNLELILVDNNSQDGSLEMAKLSFPKMTFIKNDQNVGFSAGNNVGIRYALEKGADYVLLLNNDTEVEEDFVSKLIKAAQDNPKSGILSPVIYKGGSKSIWFSGGHINWLSMKTVHDRSMKSDKPYKTKFISGCAMLVKAEVFKKIGLLDEEFFLYWEDADFSTRARRAGFELLIVPSSLVGHFEKSEDNKKNKVYWLVISGLIFFKKNTPLWLSPWISGYLLLRKMKNKIDVRLGKNELARTVQKAYKDLKYVS